MGARRGEEEEEGEEQGVAGRRGTRALPRPPPPPTYSLMGCEAEGAVVGFTAPTTPRPPCFHAKVTARSNFTGIPIVRSGRSGSTRAPRRGNGGPRLWACPVTRVGRQTGPAACCHVTGPERAAAWRLSQHATWIPPRCLKYCESQRRASPTRSSRPDGIKQEPCVEHTERETAQASRPIIRGASPASGTTVGVMGHG